MVRSLAQPAWPTTAHPLSILIPYMSLSLCAPSQPLVSLNLIQSSPSSPTSCWHPLPPWMSSIFPSLIKREPSVPLPRQVRDPIHITHLPSFLVFCSSSAASWSDVRRTGHRRTGPSSEALQGSRSCNGEGSMLQSSNGDAGTSHSARYNDGVKSYNGCRILLESAMRIAMPPPKAAYVVGDAGTSVMRSCNRY